jgi:hypothetical protein
MNTRDVAGLRVPHLHRIIEALKEQHERSTAESIRRLESPHVHAHRVVKHTSVAV